MLTSPSCAACSVAPVAICADDAAELAHLTHHPLDRLAGVADELHPMVDLGRRGGDQRLDFLGGFGRALGERAHFRGDDGKTPARLAGARGFDAGVQGEQIGLERDLIDHADNLVDLPRRFRDARP